ncbi:MULTISPECIES: hypothetical protein [Rhizobium]|uniref:Threonine/homoserine/homoserine lactone efflux protein n=1 Tax=Rhizobium paranaense TaxID=1650438 RepID=A0A7W9D3Q1_9HYPH|nr:hypothetical protein [Rhizobium paranaense]MBB5576617.1 threonine/homoserine/homoserine lactone efflux protein [Rhizobium paranaense]
MFPILVRLPLAVAGAIAGWFVAEGTLRYNIVQMGIAFIMLAAFITTCIYAPTLLRWLGIIRDRPRDGP